MPLVRPLLFATAALLLAALPGSASAQSTVEAEKLFRDGKKLMKQQKLAEACEAFEASQRIEPNIATLLNLADCREKNRQLASAWGHFLKAASQTRRDAKQAALNATARKRAAAIEPRLSYLTVNVPDESRIQGLQVFRNGVAVDPGTFNRAVPVDGGDYEIAGKAPGHEPWSTRITVAPENDRRAVEVPKFKELPELLDVEAEPPDDGDNELLLPPPPRWTPMRYGAVGAAGAAAVALAGGVAFGLSARSLDSDAEALCPPDSCTEPQAAAANDKRDTANRRALLANVAFGVSAVAAVGSGVLWFLGRPPSEAALERDPDEISIRPRIGGFTGVTVQGRF